MALKELTVVIGSLTISNSFDQPFSILICILFCVGIPLTTSVLVAFKFPVDSVTSGTSPRSGLNVMLYW